MSKYFLVFGALLLSSGCASTSTFNSYTSQLNPVIQNIKENKSIDLTKQFAPQMNSADKILYLMERGRIAQIQGDFDTSRTNFEAAINAIKENDQKAIISASGAGAQSGALLVNDNAVPYKGDGYERVMLYHFQAMNYLAKNDIEGAGVEVRRANLEQEEALKLHEKELQQAQESARNNKVPTQTPDSVVKVYADLDRYIGSVKNSFQNAYTFYLSGIIYEMLGQNNDAYIDYKKANEISPDNTYLQKDVLRLAQQLNMGDDLKRFKTDYPQAARSLSNTPSGGTGELIVLFEDDFIPQKEQIKIPIPVSLQAVTMTAVAFPVYHPKDMAVFPLVLSEGGNPAGSTEAICFTGALAIKALKEKVPAMVIRQLIRSALKGAAAAEAKKELGGWGSLVASAYNFISENADVRSWTTLPFDVQIMRTNLSTGEHNFAMIHPASGATLNIKVNITDRGKTIIRVIRTGSKLSAFAEYHGFLSRG